MRPIDSAMELWRRRLGCGFGRVVNEHLCCEGCLVVSTDKMFLLCRPVEISQPDKYASPAEADALDITLAAGDLAQIADAVKNFSTFQQVLFSRRFNRRVYDINQLYTKVKQWTNQTRQTQGTC